MRVLIAIVLGLVAGFLIGIVLNEVLGVLGLFLVDDATQLRALRAVPVVLALVGAGVAVALETRRPQ